VFSNSPCRETPKNALKKIKKKRRYVRTFLCELAQMYVVFSGFFSVAPRANHHITTATEITRAPHELFISKQAASKLESATPHVGVFVFLFFLFFIAGRHFRVCDSCLIGF
jgi:hypothetical protein